MKGLFDSTQINGMKLANRFVRSATWSGLADDDGYVTPRLVEVTKKLAQGGVGLIITGHAYVHPSGRHAPWQLGIDDESKIEGLTQMTDAVHRHGGKIAVQLGYGGAYLSKSRVRQMTKGDIRRLVKAYADAAVRARSSGFDAVQIFAAHGFFLSQLLCPRYNDRKDEYGGAIRNRARCLLEVLDAIRQSLGQDYPILVKLNAHDGVKDGLQLEESIQVGEMLEARGIDAIEVSGGLLNSPNVLKAPSGQQAYFETGARAFKEKIGVPLLLVGGIRTFEMSGRLLSEGVADYISLCRPLVCEPDLINRWQSGDARDAACISCNNCVEQIKAGKGVTCVPLKPDAAPSFFVHNTKAILASSPHPEGTCYVISFGLHETATGFLPMTKIHMAFPDDEREHPPLFPLGSNDQERVFQASLAIGNPGEKDSR